MGELSTEELAARQVETVVQKLADESARLITTEEQNGLANNALSSRARGFNQGQPWLRKWIEQGRASFYKTNGVLTEQTQEWTG